MAIIKCKMCGGDIEFAANKTFGTCKYCGTATTLPKLDDEKRAEQFNRGNHFRRTGDFDKALAAYERIVQEDDTDAEAHWCCALCRFGIEYVEDPATMEYFPTCHRASFDSFLTDVDYLAALEYSDGVTKRQYQKDAAKIHEAQRGILATSQNEDPFDIFLCYKETDDETGERTQDSVDAQELYYALVQEGFRVFFSRITLEDKTGTEYEPYIFAALTSAKVMIAIGSKPEYLNAVWVKNEWSRFLSFMKHDRRKTLLPCYKTMDPYDLPEQLSVLQSYDMTKIGFQQDLIYGIRKLLSETDEAVEDVIVQPEDFNPEALILRAHLVLEDGNWQEAYRLSEQVLDREPRSAQAYLVRLMAEVRVKTQEALPACPQPFDHLDSCKKASRFDAELAASLADANRVISYRNACAMKRTAKTEAEFTAAANAFYALRGYENAQTQEEECLAQAKLLGKEDAYAAARRLEQAGTSESLTRAIGIYESIPGWKDADARAENCKHLQSQALVKETSAAQQEKSNKKMRNILLIAIGAALAVIAILLFCFTNFLPNIRYKRAVSLKHKGRYDDAITVFEKLGDYKDSEAQIPECCYLEALSLMEQGSYEKAAEILEVLAGYKDSDKQRKLCQLAINYAEAETLYNNGDLAEAAMLFAKSDGYEDAMQRSFAIWDQIAVRETISADNYYTLALRADGTVLSTETDNFGQSEIRELTDIIAVSAGYMHCAVLTADHKVNAIGNNDCGQCEVFDWPEDIVSVSAGGTCTVGLRADGTVVATCYDVSDWTDIIAVSAGGSCIAGLKTDGTVVAAGDGYIDLTAVSGWTDIVAIAAGGAHLLALQSDGRAVAVGDNYFHPCDVSGWSDVVSISANLSSFGIKADGTIVTAGDNLFGMQDVRCWSDIVAITSGEAHTVGLCADGTLVTTGMNDFGQCDVSGWTDIMLPN